MEKLDKIKLNSNYNISTNILKNKKNIRSKERVKYYADLKFKIIIFNICISLALGILLAVGYTDMVGISSDKLLLENKNYNLEVELNTLNDTLLVNDKDKKIEKIAKTILNMVYPTSKNLVKLDNQNKEDLSKVSLDN